MKYVLLASVASITALMTAPALARGGGPGHVVHCSYEGTNSPNQSWSTLTADGDDTIHATNLCLSQGGNVFIDRASNNPPTQY